MLIGSYDGEPDNFPLSMQTLSNEWITYGVEMSANPQDTYVQFYLRRADSSVRNGRKVCQYSCSEI